MSLLQFCCHLSPILDYLKLFLVAVPGTASIFLDSSLLEISNWSDLCECFTCVKQCSLFTSFTSLTLWHFIQSSGLLCDACLCSGVVLYCNAITTRSLHSNWMHLDCIRQKIYNNFQYCSMKILLTLNIAAAQYPKL